jgi:hypothetical protein
MIRLPIDAPMPAAASPARTVARTALASAAQAVTTAPTAAVVDSHESSFSDSVVANSPYEQSPSTFARGDLMAYAVPMVTPLRREFGREMDVSQFLYDADCARDIIRLALTSKDARLRGYATFLNIKMFGAPAPAPRRGPAYGALRQPPSA